MIYMLDTANIDEIRKGIEYYPISGVTTNPTIISKENTNFLALLKEIRAIIGKERMLHIQVLGETTMDIIEEAQFLRKNLDGNLYIKIPVTKAGLKAIGILKKEQFNITATTIFTAQQALIAAVCGADYVAPYINHIDSIGKNGIEICKDILNLIKIYGLNTKLLAASLKSAQQVEDVCRIGAQSMTIDINLIDQTIENYLTDKNINIFKENWEQVYGKGALIKDLTQ